MEEKKKNGGARPGAGRKPVADEKKANEIFIKALRELHNSDDDDDAKAKFVKDTLLSTQRGQLFVAEHIFGKAPQVIEQTNTNIEAKDLTDEEIERIKNNLKRAY